MLPSTGMRQAYRRLQQASRAGFWSKCTWRPLLVIGLILCWPTFSRADFIWVGDWAFTLGSMTAGSSSTAMPNFGSTTAALADASGTASAVSDPTVKASGQLTVTFAREFMLVNDPLGSHVTLFGTLSGALNTTSAVKNVAARANVFVDADILDNMGATQITLLDSAAAVARKGTDNVPLLKPLSNSVPLADGTYTVKGTLDLTVSTDMGAVAIADVNANANWIVGVSARSIPEPRALEQVCVAMVVLSVWLMWGLRERRHMRQGDSYS
jgi:hypothetical protein